LGGTLAVYAREARGVRANELRLASSAKATAFANPRNAAAGILRKGDPAFAGVPTFAAYEVLPDPADPAVGPPTHTERTPLVARQGLPTGPPGTVPLALAGAVLSLWLFGQTLNIFSQIGVIVLIGIVTKNGILIVEFANQRKEAGLPLREAAIEAATRRLRPILMTSLATALGALPIAMALGAASRSRVPMGITIIGGLIFSLVLTLYVIPALYTYISGKLRVKCCIA